MSHQLPELLAELVKHAKDAHKLSAKAYATPTIHNVKKKSEDRSSDRVQLDRHLHEIHCLAVELGLADQQPHRYGEKRIALGFGRDVLDPRRGPRIPTIKDSLIVASVKREPLSEEQIKEMWRRTVGDLRTCAVTLARKVEQAHGITATTASREAGK